VCLSKNEIRSIPLLRADPLNCVFTTEKAVMISILKTLFLNFKKNLIFNPRATIRLHGHVIGENPFLGSLGFGIFIGVPLIYGAFVLLLLFNRLLFILCKDLIFL
jgi:hypothetical protein